MIAFGRIAAAGIGLFVMASQVRAQEDELPDQVALRSFAHAGSGCPADSVSGHFPADGREFVIAWESMTAEAGPGVPLSAQRRNCGINLDLEYPAGWQYTVESVSYNGQVGLEDGLQGIAGSAYYFQGEAETVRFNTLFEGPIDREFHITDFVSGNDQVWSHCEPIRSLNLNFQVRISKIGDGNPVGQVTFGGIDDGSATTILRLKWRRCL